MLMLYKLIFELSFPFASLHKKNSIYCQLHVINLQWVLCKNWELGNMNPKSSKSFQRFFLGLNVNSIL